MKIDELTVEVRDSSLERVGQILPKDLVGFKAVMRFNNVGSWEITLPVGHPVGEVLRQPGSGIVVTGPTGVLMSGPTISATNEKTSSNPNGDWIIQGADDSIVLAERLAYPEPSNSDVQTQTDAFDARVGVASTIMLGYVDDNIGPNAPVEREIPGLSISTDPIVGSTVYPSARFDVLGELLSGIASIDGLGFEIKQVDGTLEFGVYEPTDRSGQIRMDVANNTLSKTQYAYGSHALSRAIVAGQGQGTARQFIEVTSADSLEAETLWGRRIETFIDQRNTSDENELTQAGVEKLADGGATLTSVDVIPSSDLTMAYGKDWGLGDRVTVVIDEQEVSATVTTVSMSIDSDGVRVGATVGDATGVDYEALIAKKQTSVAQRVNSLERKEGGGLSYLHAISALNKGSLYGFPIPAGTVVMFAGSQGDVVDVVPAIADGTYPEHYLVGVTAHEIAVDAIGDVIQLGFVDHLDTSDWSLGTILYADPTTPGGFSTTPGAWGTPLAAVTRSHPQTGRLLVRCIPGGSGGGGGTGSGIVSGDTAPEDPIADMAWFDTTTGKLFIYFEDVDSGQWVEVQSSSGSDAAISTRVSTAEANINLLDSRVDVLESTDVSLDSRLDIVEPPVTNLTNGFYTRQILVQIDTTNRTAGAWTLGPTFDAISCAGNSKLKMMYHVPMRNDAGGWGGIYIEPQVRFNGGSWQSMGTTGHEVMHLGNADIATYRNEILLEPGISTNFTAQFRFYFRAYEGTVGWNNGINHDINAQPSGTATLMSGNNGNQHYMHIIIEEYAKA